MLGVGPFLPRPKIFFLLFAKRRFLLRQGDFCAAPTTRRNFSAQEVVNRLSQIPSCPSHSVLLQPTFKTRHKIATSH